MRVDEAMKVIETQFRMHSGEMQPDSRSVIEMALYALFHQAWNEGYNEREYLAHC